DNDISQLTPYNLPVTSNPVVRQAVPTDEYYRVARNYLKNPAFFNPPFTDAQLDSFGFPAAGSSPYIVPVNYFTGIPTPFPIPNPAANSFVDVNVGFTSVVKGDPANGPLSEGDQVTFEDASSAPGTGRYFKGTVMSFPDFTGQVVRVRVHSAGVVGGGT